jgi:DNA-binding IclR family transcriptional regulator
MFKSFKIRHRFHIRKLKYMLTSVKKALDILTLFHTVGPELTLTEIARHMELHKSSVYKLIATMVEAGFLEKNRDTNRYRLGLLVLELSGSVLGSEDVRELARPVLEELSRETGEIIHLSMLDGADIVYLEKVGQAQPLTVATKIGGRAPAYCSAMGKVLLSGLTGEELSETLGGDNLRRFTPNTITELPALEAELDRVKRQGYAIDDEEAFPGIKCVAAPIVNREGSIIAAISATVPKQRMDDERMETLSRMVTEAAQRISEKNRGLRIAQ